ncbi:MAG: ABC transporter substrate-binding protein [Prochlorotrichaceae cyanobacterium]
MGASLSSESSGQIYPRPHRFSRSRRRFLQASGSAVLGLAFSGCVRMRGGFRRPPTTVLNNSDRLYIYTWAGYIDEELIQRFTEDTGIDVVVDTYDSNETMLAKLQAGGGDNYSIIYPSDYMVREMIKLDLLLPLDHDRLERLDELFPNYQDPAYDPGNRYSLPISWGTTGLTYNTRMISTPLEDWPDLWNNVGGLTRRITMLNDVRETLGSILKGLGYSYNTQDPKAIEEAYQVLLSLKPAVASFTTDAWREQLLAGDLWVSMAYSVDASTALEESEDLAYVVPKSGSSLWTDTLVIPKRAPNVDAAYAWMNLTADPDISAALMQRLFFATPSQVAYDRLPAEFQNDTTLFPAPEILAKCEGIAPLAPEIGQLYDRYWTQLTSS